MDPEIGSAAGSVYRYLEGNGPASVAQLRRATGLTDTLVCQALGWLAREHKVLRQPTPRTVKWCLAGAC
jgi:hypothetical protein